MQWSVIPQIFFDLIARFIPGAVILIVSYAITRGPEDMLLSILAKNTEYDYTSLAAVFLFIIMSYTVGDILYDIWDRTFERLIEKKKKTAQIKWLNHCLSQYRKELATLEHETLAISVADLPEVEFMHDQLRINLKSEASRLLKLKAERRLSQVLVVGMAILSVVNIIYFIYEGNQTLYERVLTEAILIVTLVVSWLRVVRMEEYFATCTCTTWLHYNFPASSKNPMASD